MKPSEIVRLYRTASRAAERIGQKFVLDEMRLEPMFSQEQIDGIFAEIEYIEREERLFDVRLAALDSFTPADRTGTP